MAHIDELRLTFQDLYPLFIGISDTWLDSCISDAEIEIPGFSVQRFDRKNNRRGGGVALYLSSRIKYTRREDLEEDFEVIWIQVQLKSSKYLIGCVYRAPDESLDIFDYFDDVVRYATINKLEVIIVGDLNCDCLNLTLRQTKRLLEFIMANQLEQLIKQPSRVTPTTSTLIDVLITSTPHLFSEAGVINIVLSDHYPIYGVMQDPVTRLNKHRIITTRHWNDNKVNDFIADLKQVPWSMADLFDDINDMCSVLESSIKSSIDRYFPLK